MGRTALLYGALGPPIGASLFILAGIVLSLGNTGGVTVGFRNSITAVPGFVFLSYVLMEIPALIAGFFVGFLPRRWTALWFVFCAGLIGDLVTAGYLGTGSNGSLGGLAIMPLLGGYSAGALALALRCVPRPHPKPSA